jgi:hypothetical protein
MRDDERLFVTRDCLVEHGGVVILVWRHEVVLAKELHVAKHPLVAHGRNAKVALEGEKDSEVGETSFGRDKSVSNSK